MCGSGPCPLGWKLPTLGSALLSHAYVFTKGNTGLQLISPSQFHICRHWRSTAFNFILFMYSFFPPQPRYSHCFRERGREEGRGRERETDRHQFEKHWLAASQERAPTRDWTLWSTGHYNQPRQLAKASYCHFRSKCFDHNKLFKKFVGILYMSRDSLYQIEGWSTDFFFPPR